MNHLYEPANVEQDAQAYWNEQPCFEVKEDLSREKYYCLSMLPYPSGDLHMGHVRNYTIGDVITRYQTMKGKNVLQPMGWDAFGLPAENAAIERQLPPAEWTRKNIKKMRKQFQQLGYAFDWRREFATCEPEYYRWEQWLFVQLHKKGLVYRKNSIVNWDPVDETVLANEQVIDGKGWRSGAPIERREIPQWFLRITHYADELLTGLDQLDGWPDQVKAMQRNWIGRSEGCLIRFQLDRRKDPLEVFSTRPDTLMGASFLAIAPDHPIAIDRGNKNDDIAKFLKKCKKTKVAEADLATQEKLGIFSGLKAIHPLTGEKLPVWIANFVLMDYGCGALMAVPAHDERDHEFALKYDLPIKPVIAPDNKKQTEWDYHAAPFLEPGVLIHSGKWDGMKSAKASKQILQQLITQDAGEASVNYRLRDWGISRQRYWGTPIPIIYCNDCGDVPVPEADLPVRLPEDLIPTGEGSPLKKASAFVKTKCPQCGKAAKRETDTMDTFVESSWYYARYTCNDQHKSMLDDRAKYWTPVDQYIGGIEHAVMHLLYARFMHKILRDLNLLNSPEPFNHLLTQGMVLKDGVKMSKSKGNVVSPVALIKKYGADTVRLFIMFAAPPEQSLEWSDSGVEGANRFLHKLWTFAYELQNDITVLNQKGAESIGEISHHELQQQYKTLHDILAKANNDVEKLQFNTVVSACMKILNLLQTFDAKIKQELLILHEGLSILIRLLSPITPHIAHQLWRDLAYGEDVLHASWPRVNTKAIQTSQVELVVQINGKLRAKIIVPADASHDEIEALTLQESNVQRHLDGKPVRKFIVVPNRLINIVV